MTGYEPVGQGFESLAARQKALSLFERASKRGSNPERAFAVKKQSGELFLGKRSEATLGSEEGGLERSEQSTSLAAWCDRTRTPRGILLLRLIFGCIRFIIQIRIWRGL